MKNNQIWLTIAAIVVMLAVCLVCSSACIMLYLVSRTPATTNQPADTVVTESKAWYLEGATLSEQSADATVNLRYPQLVNFPDQEVMANFNAAIAADMQMIADAVLALPSTQTSVVNNANLDYSVAYASEEFISIAAQGSEYTGGAHPNALIYTFNYDLEKNTEVALGDMFAPTSNYPLVISDLCITELNARGLGDNTLTATGAGPDAKNFIFFDVTGVGSKGIEIIFPPYQVAPYAAGTQIVSIPAEKLQGLLKPEYAEIFN